MTKTQIIAAIKVAGATNDQRAFLRLYTENKISFSVAKTAFAEGLTIGSRAKLWS